MASKTSQLSTISRLFSSAVFQELAKKGQSSLFARLVRDAEVATHCSPGTNVGEVFDSAFAILKIAGSRDEYIYRSALTHKVLMGKHSLNTASMLTEFRTGTSKADLVILNGTATVFEIKSERDSLARLKDQVENYKKVFATVNVIASESHIAGVLDTVPGDVGVMCLSSRYQISTVREAEEHPERICPIMVFEALRSTEARAILKTLDRSIPVVPNTMLRAAMRDIFAGLRPQDVHAVMVKTLKRTRNLAPLSDLVNRLPRSLHAAALSVPVRRTDHDRLVGAVMTPLDATTSWD
ncbi:hypothetical protein DXV76_09245 [Rhodobacteraceae bacterium CCMM004]|nr:hypothetical protein DXV76_09245 [Rhodobacteraceae bacterium CCMM004]